MTTIRSTFALALACGLFSMQALAQPGAKSAPGSGDIATLNDTGQSMWVTVYAPDIVASGCVAAGKAKLWKIDPANRAARQVRAEMTSTPDCKALPGNKHVLCDTRMAVASYAWLRLKAQPGKCWWEPAKS